MNWKFDPTMSSAAYLALARKHARQIPLFEDLAWMLKGERFDFGVHRSHVDQLLDRSGWSADVIRDGRKPRVFIDAYVNQRGNVEVRSIGGGYKIYFDADFTRNFLREATADHYGTNRSVGEIMWIQDFASLYWKALHRKSPVAKALLFGFKARLDELIQEISAQMDVVGYMEMRLQYEGKNVASADFVPNVALEQIRAWQDEMFG